MSPFRTLLLVLLLTALGALVAAVLLADPGYLFVRAHGWEAETSVAFAVVALLLAFFAVVLLWRLLTLPLQVWRGHRRQRPRTRLAGGLDALHAGRWRQAETQLAQAADDPALRAPALLNAARAAHARGDHEAATRYLAALAETDAVAAALAEADHAGALGRHAEVAANLEALAGRGAMPPRGHLLRVRALAGAGRAAEAWGLLGGLRNAQVLPAEAFAALQRQLAAQMLAEAADANALARAWDATPGPLRKDPAVVAAYAGRAGAMGMQVAAAKALGQALEAHWDESLVAAYGRLPRAPGDEQRLGAAETWLRRHPHSPALLLALARLERGRGRVAAAQDYLHRALAQGAGAEAWEELGHLHAERDEAGPAHLCFLNALRAGRGEAVQALPGRDLRALIGDEAVVEERDEHGMPRLPS